MKKPVWKTPDPTKGDRKLTPARKAAAKAAAAKAQGMDLRPPVKSGDNPCRASRGW